MLPELSVIIVNYNGLKYLSDCLNSLRDSLRGIENEIIIIDNCSSDESIGFIKENHPEVLLIESRVNYGFGKGNNEAVKIAKGKYLLLLNNDTILLDSLKMPLEYLKKSPTVGVVSINMVDADQNTLPSAGAFPNILNMLKMKHLLISTEKRRRHSVGGIFKAGWLSGSFLLLSKKLYEDIGGFDEDYFMYVEDVDFCRKIADRGLQRIQLLDYSYVHFVGFTKDRNPLLTKGYEIYIKKHITGLYKHILLCALCINDSIRRLKRL